MPNLFFKFIFKSYNLDFFKFFKKNLYFLFFFIQFFLLFNLNSSEAFVKRESSSYKIGYNNVLLFYSNFNIFSMVFLFKNDSLLVFYPNKNNLMYHKDLFILKGFSLVTVKN